MFNLRFIITVIVFSYLPVVVLADDNTRLPDLIINSTASETEQFLSIDRWLYQLNQKNKFNGGVLIARNGKPLLMKAYGVTDHTAKKSLTTRSSFRLASVSKQFTGVAILLLVNKGHIELDHTVKNYLNGFPYRTVTVRHLLNQTSGIPDVYEEFAAEYLEDDEVLKIIDVMEMIKEDRPELDADPGAEFEYSNTNYVLLAGIIEAVSKKSFESFMREELFKPLGMKNTRVWNLVSPLPEFSKRAKDFIQNGNERIKIKTTSLDGVAGDGAVFSSLEDMLIWDEFWRSPQLLSSELLEEAFKTPELTSSGISNYGFGWNIEEGVMDHSGEWLGARTYVARYPKEKLWLVVLDNSSNSYIDSIIDSLAQAVEESLLIDE